MGDSLKRTSLYVGGSSPGKMLEARFYHEDCVVYDLEDSVAADSKDAARFLVYEAVRYHRPPDKYVLIRVNGIYSAELPEDLEMAVRARPDALRIPKVEHPEEIVNIDREITRIERQAGIPVGQTELWCNIESALGAVHAREIALSSPRVVALALGADACILARPYVTAVYGGGAEGVRLLTEKLKAELSDAMAMCGVHSLSQITHALVF